jgi:hypothetical protein
MSLSESDQLFSRTTGFDANHDVARNSAPHSKYLALYKKRLDALALALVFTACKLMHHLTF